MSWWQTPAGMQLLAEEEPLLTSEVRRFHGDHLLWLGCHSPSAESVRRCMVRNRFMAVAPCDLGTTLHDTALRAAAETHSTADTHSAADTASKPDQESRDVPPEVNIASFTAHAQELPLGNGSMDAIMLHHVLECADDPRAVLREVSRVLAPGGRLVISVFNPLSVWGLANVGVRCRAWVLGRRAHHVARLLDRHRLLDWLALLDIEVDRPVRYTGFGVSDSASPTRRAALANWLHGRQAPIGRSFLVAATKRRRAMGPKLRARDLAGSKLAPVTYPKLAAWNRVDQDR